MEEEVKTRRPIAKSSLAERELDKAKDQFDEFDKSVKELTLDRLNAAPKQEQEKQTNLSEKSISNSKEITLKPARSISSQEKFNEVFRKDYEFKKEYVHFTAENREIIGETMEFWTKPFPGLPFEFWQVPANKPVWGPRYVAEQIKGCKYHRLVTDESTMTQNGSNAQFYGGMIVDTTVQRLDAHPVSSRKSVFMGTNAF